MSPRRRAELDRTRVRALLLLVFLLPWVGCAESIKATKGASALRNAQNLFNEASRETVKHLPDTPPPTSVKEKYQRVVEITNKEVLDNVNRDDLKVTAYALLSFSYWQVGDFSEAKTIAEKGLDLSKRAGLTTNRRDYGMLLIVGGLTRHSEAYREYQAKRTQVAFLSPGDAQELANSMEGALQKIDAINGEMDKNEPIVIYANQQQLRVIKNILDVWGDVERKEDRRQPICAWVNRADTVWKTRFPGGDYPAKSTMDSLHEDMMRLKERLEPCP